MNYKTILTPSLAILFLFSCVTPIQIEPFQSKQSIQTYPVSGEVVYGNLGETLVSKTILNMDKGVEILNEIVWEVQRVKFTVPPQKVARTHKYNDITFFKNLEFKVEGNNIGPIVALRKFPDKGYVLWEGVWGKKLPIAQNDIQEAEVASEVPVSFEQQLIYNGRVDNNLRFVYREFSDDMARSAFSQEVQYDLEESNVIGFKSVRIEVIEATNSRIQYKVLQPFF
tara:strand:- start:450 stop:1127 length:678 start_codon:yes stop_codon:yes gene_type:complete